MKTLRSIACAGFALAFAMGTVLAATPSSFEGTVKDPNGRVLPGAEVNVVKDGKTISKVKTNADGHFVTAPVEPGVYRLDLLVNKAVVARFDKAKAGIASAKHMDVVLRRSPRLIWVVDTGTNIGRWVDLDNPNSQVPMQPVYKTDADYLRRLQDRTAGAMK